MWHLYNTGEDGVQGIPCRLRQSDLTNENTENSSCFWESIIDMFFLILPAKYNQKPSFLYIK
jgi:hypothetical protein